MNKYQTPKPQPQFNPLSTQQREEIAKALKMNVNDGASLVINKNNTRFEYVKKELDEAIADQLVIDCIKNIPSHYSE